LSAVRVSGETCASNSSTGNSVLTSARVACGIGTGVGGGTVITTPVVKRRVFTVSVSGSGNTSCETSFVGVQGCSVFVVLFALHAER